MTKTSPLASPSIPALVAFAFVTGAAATGCASLTPPFDQMKASAMTVYRLQNYEPPAQAAAPGAANPLGGLTLPPQIQQWITAGASLLPPGLLPPGLIPGTAPQAAPAPDAQRFHNFRILDYRQIDDAGLKGDIVNVFGHGSSFQSSPAACMYAEFGFAIAQPSNPTPADILVSLSCEQVQAYNFSWPYPQTGITPDTSKKLGSLAQRIFQGH